MSQILTTAGNPTDRPVSVSFRYDGASRIVDNIDFDAEHDLIIGFEMRKSGKFSYRIKKFSLPKIANLKLIEPPVRRGPILSRPTNG